jgi:hypothetical protein
VSSLTCPACGALVAFQSAAPFAVCSHCQSLLVRRDVSLESLGRAAQVPADFSPLQLNTGGVFDKHRFTLIGRMRKTWAEGSWSEWCALFDDQRLGWLAEAQGDLVMTFERSADAFAKPKSPDSFPRAAAGDSLTLDGRPFTVSDVKQVTCTGAEGELAAGLLLDKNLKSIDLRGPGLEFATIEVGAKAVQLFMGRYVEFEECRFTGLRKLEGW